MPDALKRLVMAIPVIAMLTIPQPRADAGQADCATVMSALNRQVRASSGKGPDMKAVAKKVGTTRVWVEHCMEAYGRRVPGLGLEQGAQAKEDRLEEFEEKEPEEELSEDLAEPEYERTQDRARKAESKERVSRGKRTPTPGGFKGY